MLKTNYINMFSMYDVLFAGNLYLKVYYIRRTILYSTKGWAKE